jgi:serine/threonine protein kinase
MGNTTGKNKELGLDGVITKESKVRRPDNRFATEKNLKNLEDFKMNSCDYDTFAINLNNNLDDFYTNFRKLNKDIQTKCDKIDQNLITQIYDNIDNYILLKTIGKGSFGKVLSVKSKIDGKFYALKVLKKIDVIKSNIIERIKTEKRVLQKIEHPFLIKLHSSFQSENKIFFLMDLCHGGEIFFHLQRNKRFSEDCVKFFSVQLYSALSFLHSNRIIYRDLKPENIMLDRNGYIKLIDLGMVKDRFQEHNASNTVCGTSQYLRKQILLINIAPEVIKGETYGFNFDWWGFGILMYEMLIGIPPFMDMDKTVLYKKIVEDDLSFKYYGEKVRISDHAKDLIKKLLIKNPSKRIKPRDIPSHKWFSDIKFNDIIIGKYKSPFVPKIKGLDDLSNFDKEFLEESCISPNKSRKDISECLLKNGGSIL